MKEKTSRYSELLDQSREKREWHRLRVLKSGVILFNNGYSSFACKVKNKHEMGAMVECASTLGIPAEFDFRIGGQGSSVPAKIVWRTETKIGLAFT